MFGKRKQARHGMRLGFFLVGCLSIFSFYSASQPRITEVAYTIDSAEQEYYAQLPLLVEGIPAEPFSVRIQMDLPRIHPILFLVAPDDCLDSITVNGLQVKKSGLPFCDFEHSKRFNLFSSLQAGENTIEMQMRNKGWPGGVDLSVSWMDPTVLLPFLVFLVLVYWYASTYWNGKKKRGVRSFLRSFSANERQQCASFFRITTGVLFAVGMLVGFWYLIERAGYELQSPYTADMSIYLGVGRGILNGLIPYADLFENKPPGIFLLAAASLWMFNDSTFMHIVQTLILLGFFYVFGIWFIAKELKNSLKKSITTSTALLGCATIFFSIAIAMYTALRSGEAQVESYGAFFGFLYLLIIASRKRTLSMWSTFFAGVFLMLSIGFKEPFLLVAFAGALLVTRGQWHRLWKAFAIPMIVAVTMGVLLMLLLGYIGPYIFVYLQEMTGHHIPNGVPVWLRGFEWKKIWYDIKDFSPYFAYSMVLLIGSYLYHRWKENKNPLLLVFQICIVFLSLYLLNLAVGMGGAYYNHHFAFGIPVYVAFFLVFLEDAKAFWKDKGTRCLAIAIAFLLCFSMFVHTRVPYAHFLDIFSEETKNPMEVAQVIDDILDACDIEQYLFLGGNNQQPYAYTKHSPLGPLFFQYNYSLSNDRVWFRKQFRAALHKADLVIVRGYALHTMHKEVESYLKENFSEQKWDCAADSIAGKSLGEYRILFKTNAR